MTELQELEHSLLEKGFGIVWLGRTTRGAWLRLFCASNAERYGDTHLESLVEFSVLLSRGPGQFATCRNQDPLRALRDAEFELGLLLAWVS